MSSTIVVDLDTGNMHDVHAIANVISAALGLQTIQFSIQVDPGNEETDKETAARNRRARLYPRAKVALDKIDDAIREFYGDSRD